MTLKLVLRGLWRHKVRTIITAASLVVGHLLGLVFIALNGGGHEMMVELGIRQGSAGHVVLQAPGYQKQRSVELLLPNPEQLARQVRAALPKARVTMRAFGAGLARSSSGSVALMLAGVVPRSERELSEMPKHIKRGVYLGVVPGGTAPAAADPLWCARSQPAGRPRVRPIVVGAELAKTLHLELCDKLVIDAQGLGSRESGQFRLVGIFKTGSSDIDSAFAQIEIGDMQQLLHLGEGVHQIAIFVADAAASSPALQVLRSRRDPSLAAHSELLGWKEAMPELAEFIWLDEAGGWIFLLILYLIVAIGIVNTILMSVMERTRELGIMRALGAGPLRILQLILAEGLVLGLFGVVLGTLLALPLLHYLATVGIDLTQYTEGGAMEAGGVAMTVMTARITPMEVLWAGLAVCGMAVVAAIYPAARAARMGLIRAIYQL